MVERLDIPLDKNSDFFQDVNMGVVPGFSIVEKFGFANIGTTLVPISIGKRYQTPTTPTSLEVLSSSPLDDVGSTGATKVTITGIVDGWIEDSEEVELNGTTPVPLTKDFLRVYRWYVSESGTYANDQGGSQQGTLTLREAGAGDTWSTIDLADTGFGKGQSQIAAFTVPKGKVGYVLSKNVYIQGTLTPNIFFFRRDNADDITTPYSGTMRLLEQEIGVSGQLRSNLKGSFGPFVGPSDIGFMGKINAGTANISIDFEILLVDERLVNI